MKLRTQQQTAGQENFEGQFLEKSNTITKGHLYRLDKKKTFLFHESSLSVCSLSMYQKGTIFIQ